MKRVPVLRRLIANEVTVSCNFAFSFSVSMSVISIAWVLYRPALGAGLLMAAISPIMYGAMGFYNNGPTNNPYMYNRL